MPSENLFSKSLEAHSCSLGSVVVQQSEFCSVSREKSALKIGAMQVAEMTVALGRWGRAVCLLLEVPGNASKGWHQENSLSCSVMEDIVLEKAGVLWGNNNVKNIIENADFVRLHFIPILVTRGNAVLGSVPSVPGRCSLEEALCVVSTCVLFQPRRRGHGLWTVCCQKPGGIRESSGAAELPRD